MIKDQYGDLFKGIGCMEGNYDIKIDETVTPVVHPPRKVPIAFKNQLKDTLKYMVE